jgi:hypothetical protein
LSAPSAPTPRHIHRGEALASCVQGLREQRPTQRRRPDAVLDGKGEDYDSGYLTPESIACVLNGLSTPNCIIEQMSGTLTS